MNKNSAPYTIFDSRKNRGLGNFLVRSSCDLIVYSFVSYQLYKYQLRAGFDAEQTGREKISLYEAFLGFSPSEMETKEQSIAEFSELNEVPDMPVKYCYSGTYGHLAFSISMLTHADKLLRQSNIVVIVTHKFNQVKKLCNRAIMIDKSNVVYDGGHQVLIDYYVRNIYPSPTKTARN